MQTFLPYESFTRSARSLDRQRLGKQRVEALQLVKVLMTLNENGRRGWSNHPAAIMWSDHPLALARYGMIVSKVWLERGYKDTCYGKIRALVGDFTIEEIRNAPNPPWLGFEPFHLSHQSNLVRKDAGWYAPQFRGVPATLPYLWPAPTRVSDGFPYFSITPGKV